MNLIDPSTVRLDAPFYHPVLGPMWITKKTATHISFYMQSGERKFGRFKIRWSEFETGQIEDPTHVPRMSSRRFPHSSTPKLQNSKTMAKTKSKPTPKKQPDLPEMKGPGVEQPEIPEIEDAAEKYVEVRDRRMKLTEQECTVRGALSEVMHAHKGTLPQDQDGNSFYPFDGKRVILLNGKERIKVKEINDPDDADVE